MKERPQQTGTLPGLVDGPGALRFQVQQVVRNVVGQIRILRTVSHVLYRIRVRSVRRVLDSEPFVAEHRLSGFLIDPSSVHRNDQLASQRTLHLPQGRLGLFGHDVLVVCGKVQPDTTAPAGETPIARAISTGLIPWPIKAIACRRRRSNSSADPFGLMEVSFHSLEGSSTIQQVLH